MSIYFPYFLKKIKKKKLCSPTYTLLCVREMSWVVWFVLFYDFFFSFFFAFYFFYTFLFYLFPFYLVLRFALFVHSENIKWAEKKNIVHSISFDFVAQVENLKMKRNERKKIVYIFWIAIRLRTKEGSSLNI